MNVVLYSVTYHFDIAYRRKGEQNIQYLLKTVVATNKLWVKQNVNEPGVVLRASSQDGTHLHVNIMLAFSAPTSNMLGVCSCASVKKLVPKASSFKNTFFSPSH